MNAASRRRWIQALYASWPRRFLTLRSIWSYASAKVSFLALVSASLRTMKPHPPRSTSFETSPTLREAITFAISGRNATSGLTSFHTPPSFACESAENLRARSANGSPFLRRARTSSPRVETGGVFLSPGSAGLSRTTLTVVFASVR